MRSPSSTVARHTTICCAVDLHSCCLHYLRQVKGPLAVCISINDGAGHRVSSTVSNEFEGSPWCSGVFTFLVFGRPIHLLVTRLCIDPEWRYHQCWLHHIPPLSPSCSPGKVGPQAAICGCALAMTIGVATSAGSALPELHLPHCEQPAIPPGPWDCHQMLDHGYLTPASQKH